MHQQSKKQRDTKNVHLSHLIENRSNMLLIYEFFISYPISGFVFFGVWSLLFAHINQICHTFTFISTQSIFFFSSMLNNNHVELVINSCATTSMTHVTHILIEYIRYSRPLSRTNKSNQNIVIVMVVHHQNGIYEIDATLT